MNTISRILGESKARQKVENAHATYSITCNLSRRTVASGLTASQVFEWAEKHNQDDDWHIEMRDGSFYCAYGDAEIKQCSISTIVGHDFTVSEDSE